MNARGGERAGCGGERTKQSFLIRYGRKNTAQRMIVHRRTKRERGEAATSASER